MRKLLVVLVIIVALGAFSPIEAVAKPAYCLTALRGCYGDCRELFSWEWARSACYAGCLIGYSGCG